MNVCFHNNKIENCLKCNNINSINIRDDINEPAHYHSNGIDVIGYSEMQFSKEQLIGSHRINVLKYVTRFDKKGSPLKDLKKARFYIDKLIELEGDNDVKNY